MSTRPKQPFETRADRGYFLFRINSGSFGPVFLRIPTNNELNSYLAEKRVAFDRAMPNLLKSREQQLAKARDAKSRGVAFTGSIPAEPTIENFDFVYNQVKNLQSVNLGHFIEKNETGRTLLIEALPGDYILYGLGYGGAMTTCFCLGTVGFPVRTGEITDLGTILIDGASGLNKSAIPQLSEESGFGPSVNGHSILLVAGILPTVAGTALPTLLAKHPVNNAGYHAVGKFVSPGVASINRIAPVPGVLSYHGGKVIDPQSSLEVPSSF